eukprot:scaffold5651_cov108-Isochrysis_galbana.AAC.6
MGIEGAGRMCSYAIEREERERGIWIHGEGAKRNLKKKGDRGSMCTRGNRMMGVVGGGRGDSRIRQYHTRWASNQTGSNRMEVERGCRIAQHGAAVPANVGHSREQRQEADSSASWWTAAAPALARDKRRRGNRRADTEPLPAHPPRHIPGASVGPGNRARAFLSFFSSSPLSAKPARPPPLAPPEKRPPIDSPPMKICGKLVCPVMRPSSARIALPLGPRRNHSRPGSTTVTLHPVD